MNLLFMWIIIDCSCEIFSAVTFQLRSTWLHKSLKKDQCPKFDQQSIILQCLTLRIHSNTHPSPCWCFCQYHRFNVRNFTPLHLLKYGLSFFSCEKLHHKLCRVISNFLRHCTYPGQPLCEKCHRKLSLISITHEVILTS